MKKTTIILLAVLFFAACQDENNFITFEIDKPSLTIGAEGGTEYLQVVSGTEWVAVSDKPWISISPANGIGNTKCRIIVDSTLDNSVRNAMLRFSTIGETPIQVSVA